MFSIVRRVIGMVQGAYCQSEELRFGATGDGTVGGVYLNESSCCRIDFCHADTGRFEERPKAVRAVVILLLRGLKVSRVLQSLSVRDDGSPLPLFRSVQPFDVHIGEGIQSSAVPEGRF